MKIAVISDIHSNLPAFRSVMEDIRGKEPEYIICLGDIVGYGPDPNKVIELMEEDAREIISVKGNHDEAVLGGKIRKLRSNASKAVEWTKNNISDESLGVLGNMEKYETVEMDGYRFFTVHGSPDDPLNEYVDKDSSEERLNGFFEKTGAEVMLMGHTHVPYVRYLDRGLILNPGSVGQPRDKDRRASYAVIDTNQEDADIHRVPYDIDKIAKEIKASKLPDQLAERLYYGH